MRPKNQKKKHTNIPTLKTKHITASSPPVSDHHRERKLAIKFNHKVYQDLLELL